MNNINQFIFRRLAAFCVLICFIWSTVIPVPWVKASAIDLPVPGTMVSVSSAFTPVLMKGITIHPENPFRFDFIVHPGDTNLDDQAFQDESLKLIKYFMAALTVPEDEMWVNLSPYEQNRIIPEGFGDTEMGRDLLALDYLLKQLTASLIYPEDQLGSEFWQRVYDRALEVYGTSEIPMNTFNKVWIVPQKALIYTSGTSIFVQESRFKVLLEEDYLALEVNADSKKHGLGDVQEKDLKQISQVSSEVIREIIIPEIEREVNEGQTFANLRQIANSVILATWYKQNLQQSILNQVYSNQNKTQGIDTQDKAINQKIYDQYVAAFEQGVYDFIREDFDPMTREMIPRKYFSGGAVVDHTGVIKPGTRTGDIDGAKVIDAELKHAEQDLSQRDYKRSVLEFKNQVNQVVIQDSDGEFSGHNEIFQEIFDYIEDSFQEADNFSFARVSTLLDQMDASDPRVQQIREALLRLTGVYSEGEFDEDKPTLLLVQPADRSIQSAYGAILDEIGDQFNVVYFVYNHEDPQEKNGELLYSMWRSFWEEHNLQDQPYGILTYSFGSQVLRNAVIDHNEENIFKTADLIEVAVNIAGSGQSVKYLANEEMRQIMRDSKPHLQNIASYQDPFSEEGEAIQEKLFGVEANAVFNSAFNSNFFLIAEHDEHGAPAESDVNPEALERWKSRIKNALGKNYQIFSFDQSGRSEDQTHYKIISDKRTVDFVKNRFAQKLLNPVSRDVAKIKSLADRSSIAQWTSHFEQMREHAQQDPDNYHYVHLRFDRGDEDSLESVIRFPKGMSESASKTVARYIANLIYNVTITKGAFKIVLTSDQTEMYRQVRDDFFQEYGHDDVQLSIRKIIQSTYGDFEFEIVEGEKSVDLSAESTDLGGIDHRGINLVIPSHESNEELSVDSVLIPGARWVLDQYYKGKGVPKAEQKGRVLIANVGMTKSKLVIVDVDEQGATKYKKELIVNTIVPDDELDSVTSFQDRISENIKKVLEMNEVQPDEILAIGLSVASRVEDGKFLELSIGLSKELTDNRLEAYLETDQVVSRALNNKKIFLINDLNYQALSLSEYTGIRNALSIRYGTTPSISFVDEQGHATAGYPGLFAKVRLAITDEGLSDPVTGVNGVSRNYLSWTGIAYIAQFQGLYKKYGWDERIEANQFERGQRAEDVPRRLAKWLIEGTAEEQQDARRVFEEAGYWIATYVHELSQYYSFENVILGGSLFAGEAGQVMVETARRTLSENQWNQRHHRPTDKDLGGIDLNPSLYDVQFNGTANQLNIEFNNNVTFDPNFEGLVPVIINVSPLVDVMKK